MYLLHFFIDYCPSKELSIIFIFFYNNVFTTTVIAKDTTADTPNAPAAYFCNTSDVNICAYACFNAKLLKSQTCMHRST